VVDNVAVVSTGVPAPVEGRTFAAQPVSGTVLAQRPGASTFEPLPAGASLPVGTIVDARRGVVRITAIRDGKVFSADFYEGVFKLTQLAKKGATTDLTLVGGSFRSCPSGLRASAKKSVRHLWGSGAGPFRTVGRFSSATVRGTTWLTDDQCTGTLTKVTAGSVAVRDFVKKQTVVVRKGKSYFAAARRR
jgi:hypothetical protein